MTRKVRRAAANSDGCCDVLVNRSVKPIFKIFLVDWLSWRTTKKEKERERERFGCGIILYDYPADIDCYLESNSPLQRFLRQTILLKNEISSVYWSSQRSCKTDCWLHTVWECSWSSGWELCGFEACCWICKVIQLSIDLVYPLIFPAPFMIITVTNFYHNVMHLCNRL